MKKLILFILLNTLVLADSFEEYKKDHLQSYKNYEESLEEEFNGYKNEILKKWRIPETFTQKSWVEYSDDYSEKLVINYEKESIKAEIIVDKDSDLEEAKKDIYKSIEKLMVRTTEEATEALPLKELKGGVIREGESLVGDVYGIDRNDKDISRNVAKLIEANTIEYKKAKEPDKTVVSLEIPFPERGLSNKAKKYQKSVYESSKINNIPPSLIYSIIECESSFNPMAISPIPAYGLMQIVPTSAGRDISRKLEGKERILTSGELYNGNKNIEYGSTYLNILYYSYLKSIEDERSRLYCTIAAYNTGAGNVARAFTGTTNMKKAAKIINKMNSEEVYDQLLRDLPYKETINYLQKVRATLKKYQKIS